MAELTLAEAPAAKPMPTPSYATAKADLQHRIREIETWWEQQRRNGYPPIPRSEQRAASLLVFELQDLWARLQQLEGRPSPHPQKDAAIRRLRKRLEARERLAALAPPGATSVVPTTPNARMQCVTQSAEPHMGANGRISWRLFLSVKQR